MNFDQMLETWKAQDEKPLYGVNRELLQLVITHEQADLRRKLRKEQWTAYIMGSVMALVAALSLWAFIYYRGPVLETAAAALGITTFVAWVAAMWISRRRQARRERQFDNTLRDEIGRNLSLLDYRLSLTGRWIGILWAMPIVVGVVLFLWFSAAINTDTDPWFSVWMIVVLIVIVVTSARKMSEQTKRELEPRRQRLRELLDGLEG
ncbi:hypothetical protein [Altererythrobacter sp. Root672]|uniref:hypothetical protein n=1 Tax=Altererythrobacter sp. Root672 TaxID=1736584 RepID=UPI0006FC9D50|nr:hypothetical protein [Altererythrobacter sp. Root672]KRA81638.1 hypothetical protein ASD76_14035 [Altererythrobacter sp. Root672]